MIARITPIATGLREVLAVEADERALQVAVVAREGEAVVVRRAARVDAKGDLARDLGDALAALGGKPPRRAILVSGRATAVVLQVPPTSGLPGERVRGLVRYELEPYLHGELRDGADLACGWAERGALAEAPGSMLACGLTSLARDEAWAAFKQAGLQLVGIYPQLGCAAALLPAAAAEDAVVIEHAAGRLAASRLRGGDVSRLVLQRAGLELEEQALACRGLCDDARDLVLAGPLDPSLLADLADLAPTHVGLAAPAGGPQASASLLGAAHHALGLPGGARVAAINAQPPRAPLLRRPLVRGLLALALPLLLAAGADVVVRARLAAATVAVQRLEADDGLRRAAAGARKQLEAQRDAVSRELPALRAAAAEHEAAEGRREWLLGLLRGLSAAASSSSGGGVRIDGLHEDPDGAVRVTGVARGQVDVQAFVRDLARAPALAGHPPRGARVTREEQAPSGATYRFEVRFGGDVAGGGRAATGAGRR